jgi:hypothetical protein
MRCRIAAPHVIAYRAMLDVPGGLVHYVAHLLAAERRSMNSCCVTTASSR